MGQLRQREAEAVRRLTELSSRLGPNHPDRRSAVSELAAARAETAAEAQRIVASLSEQTQAAREREADLARQLEQARSVATRLGAVQAELLQLEKDSDSRRTLHQNLMQRVEQSAAEPRDPQVLGVQIVSYAIPPNEPSAPRPALSGGIGALLGLCMGGLVTVVSRRQRGVFRDLADLAEETRLPVVAAVPRAAGWRSQTSLLGRIGAEPRGMEAEVLRGLRAQMRFVSPQSAPRSVALAACAAGESASTVAAAFARVAALDGLRVLLIEGDLQRPSLAAALGAPAGSNGLLAAFSQSAPWGDSVTRDEVTPLDLLLVADPPPNARQLLESVRFQQLLADACDEYNLVVVNAPTATVDGGHGARELRGRDRARGRGRRHAARPCEGRGGAAAGGLERADGGGADAGGGEGLRPEGGRTARGPCGGLRRGTSRSRCRRSSRRLNCRQLAGCECRQGPAWREWSHVGQA